MDTRKPVIKLDWSHLLGFDQAAPQAQEDRAANRNERRMTKLGAKFGGKPAGRMLKLGAKFGTKTARLTEGRR